MNHPFTMRVGLLCLGLLIGCQGCPADPPSEQAEAPPAPEPTMSPEEADSAVRSLLAEARKRLRADQTIVSNALGYEQALKRHDKEMEQWGMDEDMPPSALDADKLKTNIEEHARKNALDVVSLTLGQPEAAPEIPVNHEGPGPYGYTIDQLFERVPVNLTLRPADETRLRSFFAVLPKGVNPVLDLVSVRIQGSEASFTGYVYRRRVIQPPQHQVHTASLEAMAGDIGVTVPPGHRRLPEVQAMLDEHKGLHGKLESTMKILGRVHLLGLQKRFYRARMDEILQRPFPTPIGTQKPRPPTPAAPQASP